MARAGGKGLKNYAKVYRQIWHDPGFRALSAKARDLYLYLLTTPHGHSMGLFVIDDAYVAADLQWSVKDVTETRGELESLGLMQSDPAARLVFLPRVLADNRPENPNVLKAWDAALAGLPASPLLAELGKIASACLDMKWAQEWAKGLLDPCRRVCQTLSMPLPKGMPNPFDATPEGYAKPFPNGMPNPGARNPEPVTRSPSPISLSEPSVSDVGSPTALRLAERLKTLILGNHPKGKVPTDLTAWSRHIVRMIKLDKRTEAEIEAVIVFSQRDPFWSRNILSTEKLRERYDQLYLKMKGDNDDRTEGLPGSRRHPPGAARDPGSYSDAERIAGASGPLR